MPSPLDADHAAVPPPGPGEVDSLISQTRRLRGRIDAARGGTTVYTVEAADTRTRWQRALYDLAVQHLDNLGEQLDRLKENLSEEAASGEPAPHAEGAAYAPRRVDGPRSGDGERDATGRIGSAQWSLLTDEVEWSQDLYRIFGRTRNDGPLTLDELPSWLIEDDQQKLTTMVTGCLVDGRPINGEFRIVRPDGSVRTVHMVGEPVLDADGSTASLWAVLHDVSELRRTQQALRETGESLRRQEQAARTERRIAVELQESVLPPWRGPLRFPPAGGVPALDLAARYLPSATGSLIGGDWYDAMQLPDGATLLTVGDLTGHGVSATTGMAMLLGAVRGLALAGIEPDELMARLNQLLDRAAQPALGSAVCGRYDPYERTLTWAQAGHPPPLLFRDGTGRVLQPPEGRLLGATSDAAYERRTERLFAGDLLLLYTDGLVAPWADRHTGDAGPGVARLLALGPRLAGAYGAHHCVRVVVEELGLPEREDDACVLVARIS